MKRKFFAPILCLSVLILGAVHLHFNREEDIDAIAARSQMPSAAKEKAKQALLEEQLKIHRLQQKHSGLAYYFQAKALPRLPEHPDARILPGAHKHFGLDFYIDNLGARYASEVFFKKLEKKQFRKSLVVIGDSIMFGLSPFYARTFADILNESQADVRIYNIGLTGGACRQFRKIFGNIMVQSAVRPDAFLFHDGINYIPVACEADPKAEFEKYDAREFRECMQDLIAQAEDTRIPVFMMLTTLAFDEKTKDTEVYDYMVNGQCNAYVLRSMIAKHNAILRELSVGKKFVRVVDPTLAMNGVPAFYWDGAHFSKEGQERFARLLKDEVFPALR